MPEEGNEGLMERIQLKDFLDFTYLSDVLMSQDGSLAAYLTHKCDLPDSYLTQLCLTDLNGQVKPVSPAGKKPLYTWESASTLLYGYVENGVTAFTRYFANSELAVPAFKVPLAVRSIQPIGGTRYLVSAKTDLYPEDHQDDDCCIVSELPTSANGVGYISGTRNSLFIFDSLTGDAKMITPATFDAMQFDYCEAQQKIVICGQCFDYKKIIKGGISVYDLNTDELTEVIAPGTYRMTFASMMGDKLIFAGTLGKYNTIMENPHFFLMDLASGEITDLAYPDLYVGGLSVGSDCRYGGGIHCKMMDDKVLFTSTHIGDSALFELTPSGETREVTKVHGSVDCFDAVNGKCVIVGMRDMGLEELYTVDLTTGEEKALTDYNGEYIRTHHVMKTEPLFFMNDEGTEASGWVMKPIDFDPNKTYPAILDIHGGPKCTYGGEVYYHEMQIWAQMGYFVFFCNPRGSDGHGDVYSRIMGLNGTKDYDDIMHFTDLVLEKYPQIDPKRVGVTGGSYGGYMTNWIVGHTDRFACAATQRSIGDWIVHEYNCDTGYWVTSENFPPNAITMAEKAWDNSPGKHAIKCKTPILFIHSDRDSRCTLPEAMAAYASCIRAGATVRMCLFHGENHELSRSGKPHNRVKRLEEITNWMDKYLKEAQQ